MPDNYAVNDLLERLPSYRKLIKTLEFRYPRYTGDKLGIFSELFYYRRSRRCEKRQS